MAKEDIDLLTLIKNCFSFCKNRKWLLIFCFLLGILLQFIQIRINPLKYRSFYRKDFFVQSSVIEKKILSDILNEIPEIIAHNNLNKIDSLYGIPSDLWNQLKSLEVNNSYAYSEDVAFIKITFEVYDEHLANPIIKGIENYLSSITFFKSKYLINQRNKSQMLAILNLNLKELDSLKNIDLHATNKLPYLINRSEEKYHYVSLMEKKQIIEADTLFPKLVNFVEISSPFIYINNLKDLLAGFFGYGILASMVGVIFDLILKTWRFSK